MKAMRLNKAAIEFNVGKDTIIEFLKKKGFEENFKPSSKLNPEMVSLLVEEYQSEKDVKEKANEKVMITSRMPLSIDHDEEDDTTTEEDKSSDHLMIQDTSLSDTVAEETVEEPTEEDQPEAVTEPVNTVEEEVSEDISEEQTPPVAPPKSEEEKPQEDLKPEEETVVEDKQDIVEAVTEEPVAEKESPAEEETTASKPESSNTPKVVDKIDLDNINWSTRPKPKSKAEKKKERAKKKEENRIKPQAAKPQAVKDVENKPEQPQASTPVKEEVETIKAHAERLTGPKILGSIVLEEKKKKTKRKPEASSSDKKNKSKRKRTRIKKDPVDPNSPQAKNQNAASQQAGKKGKKPNKWKKDHKKVTKAEPTEEEIQKQIKETLARLTPQGKSKGSKHRRKKRDAVSKKHEEELLHEEEGQKTIQVAEFVTPNDLANMLDIGVTEIIGTCMSIGMFVSINQRLDAETILLITEEFGYSVEFVGVEATDAIKTDEDDFTEDDLESRAPVVTVMGHVDHGKTRLLDYVRKTNVIEGEAGGITQHIGAYEVVRPDGQKITFLDTPGHEAFTAMRARGAKVTDIAIIVIAADDDVMPQTKEAINHAQAAGIPIVFAFNKIDRPTANTDNLRNQLSQMNILVEEWGGKFQSQEISALKGDGIDELLEKVLLESEMLDLKATPKRRGIGSVIESSLDKGRGYVTKVLVQDGTLKIGDMILAGSTYGKVKAMFNERNQPLKEAGPSTPVLMLGLNGAPQAGDNFNVLTDEREVKAIATKREQLQREQSIRTQKHITLDEIGRRLAIGDFKELNVIVKADVDGSVEALSDSLIKLSTTEVQLNVIHKSVGQISESDVLLASASDAIIIGFQVRPNMQARNLAEAEGIQIKHYSIIYQAIEDLKLAMEGMLAPTEEEKIVCNIEVREVFKISRVGTIAGCMVLDGKVKRSHSIRLIRDGVVVYSGKLGSLKRFKDDVKEVGKGYECGLNIENFNDIKVGDIVEAYEIVEIKRTL